MFLLLIVFYLKSSTLLIFSCGRYSTCMQYSCKVQFYPPTLLVKFTHYTEVAWGRIPHCRGRRSLSHWTRHTSKVDRGYR